jgi:hypothetical protein
LAERIRTLSDGHSPSSYGPKNWREGVADYLSLERNVALSSTAVFLLGLGEELWKKFLPKYLEALGIRNHLDNHPAARGLQLISRGFPLVTGNDHETVTRTAFLCDSLYAGIKQRRALLRRPPGNR